MFRSLAAGLVLLAASATAWAAPLTAAQKQEIDASVAEWLAQTGAPSVSIAVVTDGKIAYARAYGSSRLSPAIAASPATRYAIDSNSKQFTAAAVLRLQEDGKLSLDDTVAKYFPKLAGADAVTLRQILSHTAGYRDFWPQDYVPVEMLKPVSTEALLQEWGTRPLDFAPGTDWQYSNTGFAIAAAIVEKVSGLKLMDDLKANIFGPLQLASALDADHANLCPKDACAYTRYVGAPVRPAPKEGFGWLIGSAELAMTPSDLARWDISVMNRSLLKPASYDLLYTSSKLKDGKDVHYSLGLFVNDDHGRLQLQHDGAGSGFLSENRMWPGEKTAIIAMTNNDWSSPSAVADRIGFVVNPPSPAEARARKVYADFSRGEIDRSLFTANANALYDAAALADLKTGLAAFGPARVITLRRESNRGGMVTRSWRIVAAKGELNVVERGYPDGKLEQFKIDR